MVTVGGMDGNEIQSAIDELTSPILTAIVIPATSSKTYNDRAGTLHSY